MWKLVLILSQILALVISEDVANSTNGSFLRIPLTRTIQLSNKDDREQMEHFRNRRSLKSDAAVKNIINTFEGMAKPQQNHVVEFICSGNHLPRVDLQSHNNIIYTGSIEIGHPNAQQFVVIFDTGSSDIWVPSADSHIDSPVNQMQRKYNSSQSNSYKEDGRLFRASYGSGSVDGFTSIDQIKVGGLVIEDQIFAEVTNLSKGLFADSHTDGIFGLGFKTISRSSPRKTPLDRLKDQNLIKDRIFCFNINSQKDKVDSELIIGGCNVEAEFYLPIKKSGYWQFHMTSIEVIHHDKKTNKKQALTTECNGGCDVILDTGSTQISGPHDEISKINNLLGAKYDKKYDHYSIQCGKTDLPDVVFNFGNNQITVASKDYIIQVQPGNCVSGFNVLSGINGQIKYVFGDIILRRVISIHDMEKERIGFATKEN